MNLQIEPIADELIGKEIACDNMAVHNTSRFFTNQITPLVLALKTEYDKLGCMPPFTQKVWENIIEKRSLDDVAKAYRAACDAEISKIPSLREVQVTAVGKALQPVYDAYEKINARLLNSPENIPLEYGFIKIGKAGEPIVDTEKIREHYTLRITNERQAELYQLAQKFINVGEEIRLFLANTRIDPKDKIEWVSTQSVHGLFDSEPTGELSLNPYAVSLLS